jgi:D-beta-D-heptose 7-phosphate kinase/D-beta-D-heptose 1-phosphate adenosyltransferase
MEGGLTKMKKVWINGSFDVLHIGHVRLLEYGASLGEVRVGLDTDSRIREKKGPNRPYNNLSDRVEFISSVKYVSSVVTFDSDDELIQRIIEFKPDYMVIGDDYTHGTIIGVEHVPQVMFFNKIKGKSTSSILEYGSNSNR